ncbi:MAG: hypothetical protein AABX01_05100 [Candidatus Micrarchaeota archaeon]
MQITYLSDMLYSTDFIYAIIFLTFVIWLVMKFLFNYDDFSKSLIFAIIAIVFLPFVVAATQAGSAFVIALLLGGLAVSTAYKWPLSTSILVVLIAFIAGLMVLPAL